MIFFPESEYSPVHCTFDLPMCELVNDWTLHGDKWIKRRGAVTGNGPQTDHSNGDGKVMRNDYRDQYTCSGVLKITILHTNTIPLSIFEIM